MQGSQSLHSVCGCLAVSDSQDKGLRRQVTWKTDLSQQSSKGLLAGEHDRQGAGPGKREVYSRVLGLPNPRPVQTLLEVLRPE